MKVSLVVAASTNNVIGVDGGLPWRLPEDLRHFKSITMGKPVVMGRTTWESIGRPLPGRRNIVLTRQPGAAFDGCETASSIEEVLKMTADAAEVMVIGGGTVYQQCLPRADCIYLTRVCATLDGDTYFPEPDMTEWRVTEETHYPESEQRQFAFDIITLERRD